MALRIRVGADTYRRAYPTLLVVTHHLVEVRADGLPEAKYNESLQALDCAIVASFEAAGQGTPALVETCSGRRNYFGYVASPVAAQGIFARVMSDWPSHTLTCRIEADPEWALLKAYRDRYPW
jgi:hypothetical protein